MGNPKQKWTSEEEEALRAGVKKHGIGKWKDIQKDPEFNPFLSSRSNIDLKDKWRNMTVSSMGPREKSRGTPKAKANQDAPAATQSVPQTSAAAPIKRDAPAPAPVRRDAPAPAPVRRDAPAPALVRCDATAPAPVRRDAPATPVRRDAPAAPVSRDAPAAPVTDDSSTGLSDAITAPMYDAMIFEALSASTNPNGMDTGAIASFIEQRNELPQNFRRAISNRLRRLVHQEKLEKIQNCFKLKTDFSCGMTKAPAPKQKDIKPRQLQSPGATVEELAKIAVSQIVESEEKFIEAEYAMREAERLSLMAEDTESFLEFAKEILEQCPEGKVLLVA